MSESSARQVADGQIEAFVARLGKLDTGGRARLKRNAGRSLAEARDVLSVFYRLLPPGVPPYYQEDYFLVATLYPLAEGGGRGNLGTTLRAARSPTNGTGIDRRVEVLLDADGEQLPFRLRQAIRFVYSQRVRVDWSQLLRDLLGWDHPERYVQRRWAEAYFGEPAPRAAQRDGTVTGVEP